VEAARRGPDRLGDSCVVVSARNELVCSDECVFARREIGRTERGVYVALQLESPGKFSERESEPFR
jgi:hypothetical protein